MLKHIVEETLRAFPGSPLNTAAFQEQMNGARNMSSSCLAVI